MPAPQSSMMKQLARAKFAQNQLKVPQGWSQPQGQAAQHYGNAFHPSELTGTPDPTVPPLFTPASLNKYHTDLQHTLTEKIGGYIDGICDAICSTWSTWQSATSMAGIVINGPIAAGGQMIGPPWTPLILAQGPQTTPQFLKFTQTIATVLGTGWETFIASVKVPPLPWYPSFAAVPMPIAPPTPNTPATFAQLISVPVSVSPALLKQQMVGALGDPTAQYASEIFDCITDAFDKCLTMWKTSTMVNNVLGTGPVPTFAPPYVPVGPVMGGVGTMAPGGLT